MALSWRPRKRGLSEFACMTVSSIELYAAKPVSVTWVEMQGLHGHLKHNAVRCILSRSTSLMKFKLLCLAITR